MLDICQDFFHQLNSRDICYCHWKSNSHLQEALDGKTDLDLLVNQEDRLEFYEVLRVSNCVAVASPVYKRFPYIEDYLGFDKPTGRLIHLHVHFRLILGQRFIKNHHLPLESLFFENRIFQSGIFVPVPELELLILVIRVSMKTGVVDVVRHAVYDGLGKNETGFPTAVEEELKQLIAVVNQEKLLAILARSGLPILPATLLNFLDRFNSNELKFFDLIRMNFIILWNLRGFQRLGIEKAVPKYIYLLLANQQRLKRWFQHPRKTLCSNGFSVAVVGADGSGKSTLVSDLQQWLSWKLMVTSHYYGIPKTRWIKCIHFFIRIANKLKFLLFEEALTSVLWIVIAKCRASVSNVIQHEMSSGIIAIIDRYPMSEFLEMQHPMDGPRLAINGSKLAGIERSYYNKIHRPDLILVLKAPVEILRQRKTDLDFETHRAKVQAVNTLTGAQDLILLDATRPYTDVLFTAKTIIWDEIYQRSSING